MKSEAEECRSDIAKLVGVSKAVEGEYHLHATRAELGDVITNMRERLKKEEAVSSEKTIDEMLNELKSSLGPALSIGVGNHGFWKLIVCGDMDPEIQGRSWQYESLAMTVSHAYAHYFPPKPREWEKGATLLPSGQVRVDAPLKFKDQWEEDLSRRIRVKVIEILEGE